MTGGTYGMALRDSDPAEVGGYRIEDRLGSGGMGVVYLARSASGRRLAIKVVHSQYADDDEFRTRFRREVAAARQVSGAFTAPVVDADADATHPWMATLYIPGADLGTHVREQGPLPLPRLRGLAAGLAEALRDIHRAGVVHRDLKPANVMLAEDGPRVIDFGISRAAEFAASDVLTQTGRVMGTPPFMSPEQFASPQDVGPAADMFSLGSVLTYAATCRGPFDSPSPYETALRVVEGEPDLTGVPDELLPFVRLCLEKHQKSRPAADELFTLLRDGGTPGPRPVHGAATRPVRPWPGARPTEPAVTAWPDAARTERGETSRQLPEEADAGRDEERRPRSDRTPTEHSGPPHAPAGTPSEDEHPRSRRRPALLLASAAAAVALTAIVTTTVTLIRDNDRPDPAGDRPASSTAEAAGLPDGWKPWVATAKAPGGSDGGLGGADTSFKNCSVVDASLVCAGSDLMATRFGLADGRNTWSRPVDSTPDGASGDEGALIGTGDGRVYGYGAEDAEGTSGVGSSYAVYALAAGTGKELWRTPTGSGETAVVPDGPQGAATAVSEGVVTFYGSQGDQYALLDAETGEVRWRQPKPGDRGDCALDAAADRAYLICTAEVNDGKTAETTVSEIDQGTGKTRWTVEAQGSLQMLGRQGGLLVFTDGVSMTRGLTLIDAASRKLTVRRLAEARPEASRAYLVRGTVYFTRTGGGVRAVSPLTGRTLWESNTTVERQGPPTASATQVYFASPSGRLAALNARSGKVEATRDGRDDGGRVDSMLVTSGAQLLLVGDALYVPYGVRSVYTVDVRDL
ncbi:serine/threonine protein kinase/outer membrane protein assembly factor BamB [Streptomyces luteogriseus]|uniref:Serine/threonine protein kinase/outer membrane protein assembly factor BamB n=2 Tax=Streptomyces luteogriseus TaxID=68233 RepID=A0A7W7DSH9_9ACTN|nr:PQQ-binding-like beta-propeller repeat protein [Streptomyces luteogriseus]MBB4715230.1 serine/threonine protein kinase/outer membrane protein assembly factor BamB [Streptomyces luteogriseus]